MKLRIRLRKNLKVEIDDLKLVNYEYFSPIKSLKLDIWARAEQSPFWDYFFRAPRRKLSISKDRRNMNSQESTDV